jgi:hypothetical protein
MKWIVTHRRHKPRMIQGSETLPPHLEASTLSDVVRLMLSRSFEDFDVWYVSDSHTPQKVAAGSVPGRAPGDWFNFKYTPAPQELLLVQQNYPVGTFADAEFLHPIVFSPSRDVRLNQNEIEAALVQSDLSRDAVAIAMGYLPDMTRFYTYLEQKGAIKALDKIRRLLSY